MSDSDSDDISDLLPRGGAAGRGLPTSRAQQPPASRISKPQLPDLGSGGGNAGGVKKLPDLGLPTAASQRSVGATVAPKTAPPPPPPPVASDDDDSDISFHEGESERSSAAAAASTLKPSQAGQHHQGAPVTSAGSGTVAHTVQKFESGSAVSSGSRPTASTSAPPRVVVPATAKKFEEPQSAAPLAGANASEAATVPSSRPSGTPSTAVTQPAATAAAVVPSPGSSRPVTPPRQERQEPIIRVEEGARATTPTRSTAHQHGVQALSTAASPDEASIIARPLLLAPSGSSSSNAAHSSSAPPAASTPLPPAAGSSAAAPPSSRTGSYLDVIQRISERVAAREAPLAATYTRTTYRGASPSPSEPPGGGGNVMMFSIPSSARGSTPSGGAAQVPVVVAPTAMIPGTIEAAARDRLTRENVRLSDEIAALNAELRRMKQQTSAASNGTVEVERAKLAVELERTRELLRETSDELSRAKTQVALKSRDLDEREKRLLGEVETLSATVAQFESRLAEKEGAIAHERGTSERLRGDLREKTLEVNRVRDEVARQQEEDRRHLDRVNTMLEEAKKQRQHLLELNDRLSRDKETANAERRKWETDCRSAQRDLTDLRDRHAAELDRLTTETERQRIAWVDKERALHLQLQDEKRQRESLSARLEETEQRLNAEIQVFKSKEAATVSGLKEQIATLSKDNLDLTDQLKATERRCGELIDEKQRLTVALREASEGAARAVILGEEMKNRDRSASLEQEEARRLRQTVETLRHENASLSQALTNLEVDYSRISVQCDELNKALTAITQSDDRVAAENDVLRHELEAACAQVDTLQRELENAAALAAQNQDLSLENERLSAECQRLAKERADMMRDSARLNEDNARLRAEFHAIAARPSWSAGAQAAPSGATSTPMPSGSDLLPRATVSSSVRSSTVGAPTFAAGRMSANRASTPTGRGGPAAGGVREIL